MLLKRQQNEQKEKGLSPHRQAQMITPVAKIHSDFLRPNYSTDQGPKEGEWLDACTHEGTSAWLENEAVVLSAVDGMTVDYDLIMSLWVAGYARAVRDNGYLLPPDFGPDLGHDEPW